MPPKVKITKEEIIHTAVSIVRRSGPAALNARTIARELGCSTQPVFSNFSTMEELRLAAIREADALYREYTLREIALEKYPVYKASGMAYIRFAKEEKQLFQLLFMRDRSTEAFSEDPDDLQKLYALVQSATGLPEEKTTRFHLEIWACVHGIAAMTATNYLDLDMELVSDMLTDAYQGLKKRYEEKE